MISKAYMLLQAQSLLDHQLQMDMGAAVKDELKTWLREYGVEVRQEGMGRWTMDQSHQAHDDCLAGWPQDQEPCSKARVTMKKLENHITNKEQ